MRFTSAVAEIRVLLAESPLVLILLRLDMVGKGESKFFTTLIY